MSYMKAFKVVGTFLMKDRWQEFTKEVAAEDPGMAKESVLSDLGSKHRVPRRAVKIEKIEEIPPETAESSIVRWKAGVAK